jgi:cytochrome bd-type quinol oxidase subunit 1
VAKWFGLDELHFNDAMLIILQGAVALFGVLSAIWILAVFTY